jgi:hypothetical protein
VGLAELDPPYIKSLLVGLAERDLYANIALLSPERKATLFASRRPGGISPVG